MTVSSRRAAPAGRSGRGALPRPLAGIGLLAGAVFLAALTLSCGTPRASVSVATVAPAGAAHGAEHADHPPAAGRAGNGRAGAVEVAAPSIDLGRVPLDTPVSHAFRLRNTGTEMASLGQARIETLEGC